MDSAGYRVLIVDDEHDYAAVMAALLGQRGFATCFVIDGTKALEIARNFRPQSLIVDLVMPGQDGYELIAELRAEFSDAVIVAHSGWCEEESDTRAIIAGADRFVRKPAMADEICEAILAGCAR